MNGSEHLQIPITESSQPSAARLAARDLAHAAGLDDVDAYRVGIVVSELATNLVKHAHDGRILLRAIDADGVAGVETLAIDRGPGMANVVESLRDGHSTVGSSGNGLGAVQRLSEEFDIYSIVPRGTVVLSRIHAGRRARAATPFTIGAVSVAMVSGEPCGDRWAVHVNGRRVDALVVDGVGHGMFAAEAARAAVDVWTADGSRGAADALAVVHDGLRHTRGAAGALVEIDRDARQLQFTGVGNVAATILPASGRARQAVSHSGTLGHEARYFRAFTYPWEPGALLVVHSDGLSSHWSLEGYPGLGRRDPSVIASVLYRDFSRGRDDVTVFVCREAA